MSIRHKLRLSRTTLTPENTKLRSKIPAAFETIVSFNNHTELNHINKLALAAGATKIPFPHAETLPKDTGERFFSEYLSWMRTEKPRFDVQDYCLCCKCTGKQHALSSNSNNNLRISPPAPPLVPPPTHTRVANKTTITADLASGPPPTEQTPQTEHASNNKVVRVRQPIPPPPPIQQQQQPMLITPRIITPHTFWPPMTQWMPAFMPYPTTANSDHGVTYRESKATNCHSYSYLFKQTGEVITIILFHTLYMKLTDLYSS